MFTTAGILVLSKSRSFNFKKDEVGTRTGNIVYAVEPRSYLVVGVSEIWRRSSATTTRSLASNCFEGILGHPKSSPSMSFIPGPAASSKISAARLIRKQRTRVRTTRRGVPCRISATIPPWHSACFVSVLEFWRHFSASLATMNPIHTSTKLDDRGRQSLRLDPEVWTAIDRARLRCRPR